MILWFAGTAVLAVWYVFHDPRFDNRLLLGGVLLPDLVDIVWSAPSFDGARGFHSVTMSVVLLVAIMLATYGRRPIRRRLLAVPIGAFLHLIFDGAFNDTDVFWWPFTGSSFAGARLPIIERGPVNIVLEVIGLALCVHAWRLFGLSDPARRRLFRTSGTLAAEASNPRGPA